MKRRLMRNGGYGLIESILAFIVIGIFAVVFLDRFEQTLHVAQGTAVKAELANLRQSIALFRITKGGFPKDLKELLTSDYVAPNKEGLFVRKFIEPHSVDEEMNILDPFDKPYLYMPDTGVVKCQSKGFEGY